MMDKPTCKSVDMTSHIECYRCAISNYLMQMIWRDSEGPVADPVLRSCKQEQEFLKRDDDDTGVGIPVKGKKRQIQTDINGYKQIQTDTDT